jgi:hypothetical protein
MWYVWDTGEVRAGFRRGDPRTRDHLEDLGIDGEIILKWILKVWDGGMGRISLAQDRVRWWAFVNRVMNFGVP